MADDEPGDRVGAGGLMSLDSDEDMDWRKWGGDSVVGFFGGAGAAIGGRGGNLAGMGWGDGGSQG